MYDAGFATGSEFLWPYHYQYYWDLTQRVYREELDPAFDGDTEAGTPYCASGTPACDADYDYDARKPYTGDGEDRPHRPDRQAADHPPRHAGHAAADRPDSATSTRTWSATARPFRYYRIEDGNHVDGLYATYPDRLRPMLPCFRSAFESLEGWVERKKSPPPSATLPRPTSGDLANECRLGA